MCTLVYSLPQVGLEKKETAIESARATGWRMKDLRSKETVAGSSRTDRQIREKVPAKSRPP